MKVGDIILVDPIWEPVYLGMRYVVIEGFTAKDNVVGKDIGRAHLTVYLKDGELNE